MTEGRHKGLRPLEKEELLARELIQSFSKKDLKKVLFSDESPGEIILGPSLSAKRLEPIGFSSKKMNQNQLNVLKDLLREYVFLYSSEIADPYWKEMTEGELHFAWGGSLKQGEGHYYRIQGDDFVIEYANTQNDANHIHTVWRDLENDFGKDILKEHYQRHSK